MADRYQKLVDHVRNNLIALKYYIFYGVSNEVPIWDCYKNLCGKYGNDAMEYTDFEFWYMRFYNGELDMDYDRRFNGIASGAQDPQPRQLTQLPLEIKDKIFLNFDSIEWIKIRKVCKHFRSLIDTYDPGFKYISIETDLSQTIVWLDRHTLHYMDNVYTDPMDYQYPCTKVFRYQGYGRHVMYSNHSELAFNDLSIILKNPKLKLKKLFVKIRHTDGEELKKMFEGLGRHVCSDEVEVVTEYSCGENAVLPYLEPGTLTGVLLDVKGPLFPLNGRDDFKQRMTEFGALEQCKQAENLQIRLPNLKSEWLSIDSFMDCRSLSFGSSRLIGNKITITDVLRIKRTILKSQLRRFFVESSSDFMLDTLKRRLGKSAVEVPGRPDVRHFHIKYSNEYYEMDLTGSFNYKLKLFIVRKP